jgi:hypothetical protein
MRVLTPLELTAAGSLLACVLAVTVPVFVRNLHTSRLVEPIQGLERIAARAAVLAAGRPTDVAYPADAPLTPATVPRGELVVDPPGTWDHATWRELGFAPEQPHAFSFEFDAENSAELSKFVARARGDLDGDGSQSTFTLRGEVKRGGVPSTSSLDMHREIE